MKTYVTNTEKRRYRPAATAHAAAQKQQINTFVNNRPEMAQQRTLQAMVSQRVVKNQAPIQGGFLDRFKKKKKTAEPKIKAGKLVDANGKLLKELFSPSSQQLDTGTFWWDEPDSTWWYVSELSTEANPTAVLVDGETEEVIQDRFKPSPEQLDSGKYLLDRSTEHMILRWMYYKEPPFG